jgi:hypothetical protein
MHLPERHHGQLRAIAELVALTLTARKAAFGPLRETFEVGGIPEARKELKRASDAIAKLIERGAPIDRIRRERLRRIEASIALEDKIREQNMLISGGVVDQGRQELPFKQVFLDQLWYELASKPFECAQPTIAKILCEAGLEEGEAKRVGRQRGPVTDKLRKRRDQWSLPLDTRKTPNVRANPSRRSWLLRIADAARAVGISPDLIRKLDRRGIIALPRDRNGHRRLTPTDLEALRRVIFPHPAEARNERSA